MYLFCDVAFHPQLAIDGVQSAWLLGGGAGLGGALICILSNVWQGARHTISTMPDIVSALAIVLLIGFGARRAMRCYSEDKRQAGVRAAGGAALAFGWRWGCSRGGLPDQASFMAVGTAGP